MSNSAAHDSHNLEEFYRQKVRPYFIKQHIEKKRRAEFLKINVTPIIICFVLSGLTPKKWVLLSYIFLFIGVFLFFYTARLMKKNGFFTNLYQQHVEFKQKIVKQVIHFIDPTLTYQQAIPFPMEKFYGTQLFPKKADIHGAQDCISGVHRNIPFEFMEIKTQIKKETRSRQGNNLGTTTTYETLFKGLFFCAQFHKSFHGSTIIQTDKFESKWGFIGRGLQKWKHGSQLVELEDPEFEKKFKVYSTDQVEARYLLSTSFMRKVLDLEHHYGPGVQMAFQNSEIIIAIPSEKDFFEADSWGTGGDEQWLGQVKSFINEYHSIMDVIDILELDKNLWKTTG